MPTFWSTERSCSTTSAYFWHIHIPYKSLSPTIDKYVTNVLNFAAGRTSKEDKNIHHWFDFHDGAWVFAGNKMFSAKVVFLRPQVWFCVIHVRVCSPYIHRGRLLWLLYLGQISHCDVWIINHMVLNSAVHSTRARALNIFVFVVIVTQTLISTLYQKELNFWVFVRVKRLLILFHKAR